MPDDKRTSDGGANAVRTEMEAQNMDDGNRNLDDLLRAACREPGPPAREALDDDTLRALDLLDVDVGCPWPAVVRQLVEAYWVDRERDLWRLEHLVAAVAANERGDVAAADLYDLARLLALPAEEFEREMRERREQARDREDDES
jgi:hypothetical protein